MVRKEFTGFRIMVSLLGADYDSLQETGAGVQGKFYFSALSIIGIFVLSWLSIRYAVNLLFHIMVVEVLISLFIALLFVCIYIFLLHTFAKKQLGKEVRKRSFRESLVNSSNIVRAGFVMFIGFIIAKPIEIYLFESRLDQDVSRYREELMSSHQSHLDALYQNDENRLLNRLEREKELGLAHVNSTDSSLNSIHEQLKRLALKKEALVHVAASSVEASSFFVYRVQTVAARYPLSWLVTITIVFLFLLPGYLIYSLSEEDVYFDRKNREEMAVVLRNYRMFVSTYAQAFAGPDGSPAKVYTVFSDPPFNTQRKSLPAYNDQLTFLRKFSPRHEF